MSLANVLLEGLSDDESDFEIGSSTGESNLDTLDGSARQTEFKIQNLLTITDLESIVSIQTFCPLLKKLEILRETLKAKETNEKNDQQQLDLQEQDLLSKTNSLIAEINTYFNILIAFIRNNYSKIWPDLSNIIKNPLSYIQVIKVIKFDISRLKEFNAELEFLPKDQFLSLNMSANFLLNMKQTFTLTGRAQELILEACDILILINQTQIDFKNFVTRKIQMIAPNVTELVGPVVSSQLISSLGLDTLCATPSCNIPSIGKSTKSSYGYIVQCDLVKNTPDDFKTQAMRQVSAKVVLAARVDLGASRSKKIENTLGSKWKEDIKAKLDKLMLPPENVQIKPLPIPTDVKSKRRGGRKFKKMRERMKMSDIEKAQNKMVFGEQEATRTDAYGEEIGLGMLGKSSIRSITNIRTTQVSKGVKKKLDTFNKNTKPSSGDSKLIDLL